VRGFGRGGGPAGGAAGWRGTGRCVVIGQGDGVGWNWIGGFLDGGIDGGGIGRSGDSGGIWQIGRINIWDSADDRLQNSSFRGFGAGGVDSALFHGSAPGEDMFIGISAKRKEVALPTEQAEFQIVLLFEGHGGDVVGNVTVTIYFGFIIQNPSLQDSITNDVLAAFFLVRGFGGGFVFGFDLAGPTFMFDGGPDGAVVIAAEAGKPVLDFVEAGPALFGVLIFIEHGLGEFDEFGGEEGGEVIGEALVAGLFGEVAGSFDEPGGEVEGLLLTEPILVAAMTPLVEVLFIDGAALEVFDQDFFDVGIAIKPVEDFGGGGAIDEVLVEFVADGFGEAGDFADSSCVHGS
jgi:hypothetical protein